MEMWIQKKYNKDTMDQTYLLRHNEFLTIIEGKILCKRGRGRPNKSYCDMKKKALDMREWLF